MIELVNGEFERVGIYERHGYKACPPIPGVGKILRLVCVGGKISATRSDGNVPVEWLLIDGEWARK